MLKIWVLFFQKLRILSSVAARLTKLTGKSRETVHPKHLVKTDDLWYLKYLNQNDLVLDIGCANGQHTLRAAKFVEKIVGIDIDAKELNKGKREGKRRRIKNVEFLTSSAEEKLKFKKEAFDKVLFFDVLEHLQNQDMILFEIWRVLKSKGLLLISVPNKNTSWKKLQRSARLNYFSDPDHKREYSEDEMRKLLERYKFKILNFDPIVYDTPLAPIFDLIGGVSLTLYSKFQDWKKEKAFKSPSESTGFQIVVQKINHNNKSFLHNNL